MMPATMPPMAPPDRPLLPLSELVCAVSVMPPSWLCVSVTCDTSSPAAAEMAWVSHSEQGRQCGHVSSYRTAGIGAIKSWSAVT